MVVARIANLWWAVFACLGAFGSLGSALATVPGTPGQAPYANQWYPTVASALRYTTFTGAALYYTIVDWKPGYVERSDCKLLDGGVLITGPVAALTYGPEYIHVVYRIQCTDMWGLLRYGDIVQLRPRLQCPANSVQVGSACNCNPGFVEDGAICSASVGRPVEEDGAMCQAGAQVGNPIVPATGEKVLAHSDHAGFGPHALGFVRHYRSAWVNRGGSAGPVASALGPSWSHNHVVTLTLGGAPASSAQIRFGDGEVVRFGRTAGQTGWVGVDTTDQLEESAGAYVLSRDSDGSRYVFDPALRLARVKQRNQWQTSYRYSDAATTPDTAAQAGLLLQVSNQFGASLQFQYTPTGQLKTLITSAGEAVRYGYDASQRLSTITYPGNEVQTLLYEDSRWPLAVSGLIDERGIRLATYRYDDTGRAVLSEHALGADRYSVLMACLLVTRYP